jgi:hypothetical protein
MRAFATSSGRYRTFNTVIFEAYLRLAGGGWEPVSMTDFPRLVRSVGPARRYRLGHPLVDRYLEFVAGRARPNTLRAVAFDLMAFFTVVAKDPVAVAVFEFLDDQCGDRTVVRLVDRESGLSARTIARRQPRRARHRHDADPGR